ncbi:hypothetical protein K7X08_003750 [Anisodus acutangulus]|uniref:Uncharacterized protein n=1 Tax=Anisodus acutangulus TaxID=402998 RepID=A0A9Q1RJ27_9SOLA|nr:hypothetical protein K7X08_003750 [Anisodus acutangulus]
MRYVGRLFVKGTSKPTEILSKLNEMVGYAPDQEIELYERRDVCGAWEQYLGLEHADGAPKRTHAAHQATVAAKISSSTRCSGLFTR